MQDRRGVPASLLLAHSSDLHIDEDFTARVHGGDGAAGLRLVLAAASEAGADVLLLAGDVFDNNRVGVGTLARVAEMLAAAAIPVVILPGNHDPALAGGVFHRGRLDEVANVRILGLTDPHAVRLPEHGLEIWGRAHLDYETMHPLVPAPPRSTRWQVAMAHGHFEWRRDRANPLRPSWLFSEDDIEATGADYLALGHWDRAARVGDGAVPAYYSGSPELAGTINLVRLDPEAGVGVTRAPLRRAA